MVPFSEQRPAGAFRRSFSSRSGRVVVATYRFFVRRTSRGPAGTTHKHQLANHPLTIPWSSASCCQLPTCFGWMSTNLDVAQANTTSRRLEGSASASLARRLVASVGGQRLRLAEIPHGLSGLVGHRRHEWRVAGRGRAIQTGGRIARKHRSDQAKGDAVRLPASFLAGVHPGSRAGLQAGGRSWRRHVPLPIDAGARWDGVPPCPSHVARKGPHASHQRLYMRCQSPESKAAR